MKHARPYGGLASAIVAVVVGEEGAPPGIQTGFEISDPSVALVALADDLTETVAPARNVPESARSITVAAGGIGTFAGFTLLNPSGLWLLALRAEGVADTLRLQLPGSSIWTTPGAVTAFVSWRAPARASFQLGTDAAAFADGILIAPPIAGLNAWPQSPVFLPAGVTVKLIQAVANTGFTASLRLREIPA